MDGVDVMIAQHPLEIGVFKAGIALVLGLATGVDDRLDPTRVELGMKLRTAGVPDAVDGPGATLFLE